MRRSILFLITLLATATLWPVSAWAYTGTGTADAPYLVDNWADLKTCMAAGGYIQLTGNCTDPNPTNLTYLSVPANKTVTLDLNGYMINRGLESDIYMGFVIVVSATGTLIIDDSYNGPFDSNHADRIHDISGGETINGGLITGGKNIRQTGYNYNVGGGINNLGTLILNKGTIAGNSTNEYGGGVYVAKDNNNYSNPSSSNSSFTMNGGAILNNSSQSDGGGIYLSSGTFTMNEGTIDGNTSIDGNGGGIYHISGTLSLTGGTIENNTCNANKYGGGIYRNTNNTFNISGSPIVRNNKKGDLETGSINNLCLNYDNYDNSKITVNGALSENAQIGIFIKKTNAVLGSRVFTTGLSTNGVSERFSSDDSNYTITTDNDEAKIITYWLDLKNCFSAGGEITLDRDYISNNSEEWLVVSSGKEVILDLNGYKIDRNKKSAAASGSVIKVEGTLTIKDTYTGKDRVHPITVDGKSVDIVGGLITGGNSSGNYGGGITNAGTLILQSGTIAGNKAASGGGVFISNNKTFSMSGGTICYNIASNGGGVYLYYNSTPSTFSMNRGTISNNISTSNGGGIYSNNSNNRFEISGSPIITNNNQKSSSGSLTDNNVFLNSWKIIVANTLDKTASLGLYPNFVEQQLTQTLGGKGTESNFIIDRTGCLLRIINSEIWSMQPYTVTIADSENGSVSASATTAARYDVITVTPHPDNGFYLATLSHNNGSTTTDFLESKQFTMGPYNYTINATFAPKTSITPTVSLDNWVYGNAANAPAVEGNTGNGDVSYLYKVKDADDDTYTETVPTTVGTYTVKATVAESTQYFGATATTDFTITKRPVTITSGITANNKTYDGTTDAAIGTANAVFDGKIDSDGLTVSTTGTFADKDVGTGKTVNLGELTLGGTSVDNYKLAESGHQTTTTANITPLTLTVRADNATKTYGEENPTFTIQYSGFLSGEDETALTTLPTATCEATISSNVGSYNIVPDNGVATNYTFNYVSGRLIINPKSLTENMVTISEASTVYNGNSQKPTIALEDADANCTITENDYHISNDGSGTDVGTYNVVINGTNNYSGTVTKSDCFTITPKSIAGVSIEAIENQTYTGSAITPATVITDTDISLTPTLTENTDYTLSYSTNNTNVTGENVTITVTGKGNYDSSTSTSTIFKIVPKALEDGMIAAIADQTYTGSGIEPELAVTYNGMNLSRDTHYTAAFDNNTNTTGSGTATVTITACDNSNYSGTASASFSIVAADLSTAEVTGTSKNVDFGSSTSPAIDPLAVNFPAADYTIAYRKTYQPPIVDVTTIPTDIIGTYTVVLKPTDTGNLTGEKVTDYVVNVQLPVILKQCEWVTYFDERFDLATPSGYQAYKVSSAAVSGVTLEAIDYIPKGVPVILKTTASGISETTMNVKFDEQQETSEIIGDVSFIGVPSTATDGILPEGTAYILVSDEFILFEGTEAIPEHRCYLKFASAGTRSIGINIEGEGTTGIDSSEIQRKEMGHWYDLQGRRIEKPTQKGIYIKDGKKIVIGKEVRQ